ncbi:Protein of unknown function [Leuconostoc citreum LBAE C10]|nr:Protein of unknown function [Leuconostoc citreum LBAE C10]
MTVLAETNQFYSATFLGTTQHSLYEYTAN